MHSFQFEQLYSEYTGMSLEEIKAARLSNGSYRLPKIASANLWHKVGVLAGQGFATCDVFKIIEERLK